jgi:hypothetical protein
MNQSKKKLTYTSLKGPTGKLQSALQIRASPVIYSLIICSMEAEMAGTSVLNLFGLLEMLRALLLNFQSNSD